MIDRNGDVITLHFKRGNPLKAGDNSHLNAEHWYLVDKDGHPISANITQFTDLGEQVRHMGTINVGDVKEEDGII